MSGCSPPPQQIPLHAIPDFVRPEARNGTCADARIGFGFGLARASYRHLLRPLELDLCIEVDHYLIKSRQPHTQ
jgi:hypothetical protein